MKILFFLTAIFLAAVCRDASAEPFEISEYGFSIEMPAGWKHDSGDKFGFVVYDPQSPHKTRKIRIHKASGAATTPEAQVLVSLASVNKQREGKHPLEIIRYQKAVVSKSGLRGYMAAHGVTPNDGFVDQSMQPYINHYYFGSPSGGIVCICAYLTGADNETEATMEAQILTTLKPLHIERQKANEPVDLIPVPAGLSAWFLLDPLRGQEPFRKRAGIGHWGRSENIYYICYGTF